MSSVEPTDECEEIEIRPSEDYSLDDLVDWYNEEPEWLKQRNRMIKDWSLRYAGFPVIIRGVHVTERGKTVIKPCTH